MNVNFTVENPGTQVNGSWFKSVPNYVLPKVWFLGYCMLSLNGEWVL